MVQIYSWWGWPGHFTSSVRNFGHFLRPRQRRKYLVGQNRVACRCPNFDIRGGVLDQPMGLHGSLAEGKSITESLDFFGISRGENMCMHLHVFEIQLIITWLINCLFPHAHRCKSAFPSSSLPCACSIFAAIQVLWSWEPRGSSRIAPLRSVWFNWAT